MNRRSVIVLLLLACLGAGAQAQSTHEQAVVELFEVMGLERTMIAGATAMIDAQVQANAELEPYRDVVLEWARTYLTWEAMAPALIKIQMEYFTESEIRDMTAFYRTPTGQKALATLPEVMQRGAAIGADVATAHQTELERMILERKKALENERKP
jgi:hypothetical protein